MNRSEAGRLGAIKTKEIRKQKKNIRICEYNKKPKLCETCKKALIFKKRKNRFCSKTCAAVKNNHLRPKRIKKKITTFCLSCNKILNKKQEKYCSMKCIQEHKFLTVAIPKVENGKQNDRKGLRKYLIKTRGYKCELCNGTTWMNNKIPLEIDHVDGNASNNYPSNIRLLCPNCHALQPTSKGKNRGKGRKSRGIPRS